MAHAYQSGNRSLESGGQVAIYISRIANKIFRKIFNYLRKSHPATRSFLKETDFFSINLIFSEGTEVDLEPCQTSQTRRVAKIFNSYLFLQNALSCMFDKVLNTPLG